MAAVQVWVLPLAYFGFVVGSGGSTGCRLGTPGASCWRAPGVFGWRAASVDPAVEFMGTHRRLARRGDNSITLRAETFGLAASSALGFVECYGGFADYRSGTPGAFGWLAASVDPAEIRMRTHRRLARQGDNANKQLAVTFSLVVFHAVKTNEDYKPGTPGDFGWQVASVDPAVEIMGTHRRLARRGDNSITLRAETFGLAAPSALGFVECYGGFADYRSGTPGVFGWLAASVDPAEIRMRTHRRLARQGDNANKQLAVTFSLVVFPAVKTNEDYMPGTPVDFGWQVASVDPVEKSKDGHRRLVRRGDQQTACGARTRPAPLGVFGWQAASVDPAVEITRTHRRLARHGDDANLRHVME